MSPRNALLSVLVALVCLYGCGKADLSRGRAEALISQSPDMQALRKALVFQNDGYRKGIQQGMWTDEFQRGWHVGVLTEKGKRYFSEIAQIPMSNKRAGAPVADVKVPSINVTGIARDGETQRIADFLWTYVDLPSVVRRFVVAGGSGKAYFKLFDDGWRLDHLEAAASDEAASLSDKEKAEEQADIETARQEAAVAAKNRRAAEEARTRRVAESRTPTREIATFENISVLPGFSPGDHGKVGRVVVTDVNVQFTTYGQPCLAFYGEVAGVETHYDEGAFKVATLKSKDYHSGFNSDCPGGGGRNIHFRTAGDRDRFISTVQQALAFWRTKFADIR